MTGEHDVSPTLTNIVSKGDDPVSHGVNGIAEIFIPPRPSVPILAGMLLLIGVRLIF